VFSFLLHFVLFFFAFMSTLFLLQDGSEAKHKKRFSMGHCAAQQGPLLSRLQQLLREHGHFPKKYLHGFDV
jgi:hypothetical protein